METGAIPLHFKGLFPKIFGPVVADAWIAVHSGTRAPQPRYFFFLVSRRELVRIEMIENRTDPIKADMNPLT